ncbi:MAG: molybdopterin molybdotransferase MoeA [Candidatus Omnitrophica bacterium]|nr:molybdopterin molybdotransferase MoeA [Candidatus Omnitrophota bacterium]
MVSVEQAKKIIEANVPSPEAEAVLLKEALFGVLAEDVKAPFPLPVYDNSAMDGFVLRAGQTERASSQSPARFAVRGTIQAGDAPGRALLKNEAYRIMTGACVPQGGDAVLAQEEARVKDGFLLVEKPLAKGTNVRRKGEEAEKGSQLLSKGAQIHPGVMGILASLGRERVKVYRKPRVSLLATGNELAAPGRPLPLGKIYDSNSSMVGAALRAMRLEPLCVRTLPDRLSAIEKAVGEALRKSDVLVLMGGVSVGEYDYVKEALSRHKAQTLFWKVSQKPGKPLYFARKGRTLVFGLPGNPWSVFMCFYEYVYPALRRLMGYGRPYLFSASLPTEASLKADSGKTLFLKGRISLRGGQFRAGVLTRQSSHMISSLGGANGFMVVPPSSKGVRRGEKVEAHFLPWLV